MPGMNNELSRRDDIGVEYKWKLEDIYADNDLWEKDFEKVRKLSKEVSVFRGRLGESGEQLLKCLRYCDEMLSLNDKVFVYAKMRRDEDNANHVYQALTDRAMALSTEVYAAVSFIVPEIISIPDEKLYGFLNVIPGLRMYEHYIREILRQKKHILSAREEEILALTSEMGHAPADIFTMLNNADIRFPSIKDEKGEEVEVTKGRYIKFLESRDRRVRSDAFHALYSSYIKQKNTLAATLTGSIKNDKFYAGLRKYGSCLEASLDSDNVPVDVYDNLIDTVGRHLHLLHRYLELRKKVMKLDALHMYDLYVPIVEEPEREIPYKEALEIVEKGVSPLGESYLADLKNAFKSGWIDVYENEGKTSGAYSWGSYLTHPYVLLNYQGTINDVFTVAHEMGHALHSYYTNKTQPYIYSEYKIFVAEVASTVNEALLINYMLANSKSDSEKAFLLNHYLEEFRGTVFRQVMFAEFEKMTHAKIESGEALTTESLCKTYGGLNHKYFGNEVVLDPEIEMEWSRIPHFYNGFYVYKYATGFSAAVSLSRQILNEGKPAVDRYLKFLAGGNSDYPIELLRKAGVDLATPRPVEDALKVFEDTLGQLEKIIG